MKKIFITALIGTLSFAVTAQNDKKILTAANYEQATKFLSFNTNKWVYRTNVNPNWLADGRMWYVVSTSTTKEYVLINPADGSRKTGLNKNSILPELANDKEQGARSRRGSSTEVASPDGKN